MPTLLLISHARRSYFGYQGQLTTNQIILFGEGVILKRLLSLTACLLTLRLTPINNTFPYFCLLSVLRRGEFS